MDSLKLTEVEKGQINEIDTKVGIATLQIENCNLKVEIFKNNITQLRNSANGIIDQFCKINGKDPNKIVRLNIETGEIFFQEEEINKEA